MPYDTNLMFFSSSGSTFSGIAGATTTNQSGSSDLVDFGAADLHPITYRLSIPATTGSFVRVLVYLQGTNSLASGSNTFATFTELTGGSGIGDFGNYTQDLTGDYFITARTTYRYRRAIVSITGSGIWSTGTTYLGADTGGRYTSF